MAAVREPGKGASSSSPTPRAKTPTSEQLSMMKEAYEEGKRLNDGQRTQLEGMRQRCIQFVAFTGSASAFLIGAGLRATDRNFVFYLASSLATISTALMVTSMLALLLGVVREEGHWKIAGWTFRVDPSVLLTKIEPEIGQTTEYDYFRWLVQHYSNAGIRNLARLKSVRPWYYIVLGAGSAQLVIWGAVVWIFA